jgi:uncharacterized cofD-like protein
MLVGLAGMVCFACGFDLILTPAGPLHEALWHAWYFLTGWDMPSQLVPILTGVLLLAVGTTLAAWGVRRLIRAFTFLANPRTTGRQLLHALLERTGDTPHLHVVGLGGGTGLSTLLRGLKVYPLDLTAVVTVSDDGGSSGRLRNDLNMPPPGDIRNCLVALAEAEPLMEQLFQYRFPANSQGLDGHNLGNLIIAGMRDMTGDFQDAIREVSRVLAVRGRVLPSAEHALVLRAMMADGTVVEGETAIVSHPGTITEITISPADVRPLPETLTALRNADVIIVGPGSVYTSLLPNLVIPGIVEALLASPAIKIFVCNVMTQPGETDAFTAARHLEVVLDHLDRRNPFDYVVVNKQKPADDVLALYAEKGQNFVEPDLARIRAQGSQPIVANLLAATHLARHDHEKLARCILEAIADAGNWPSLLKPRG